MERHEEEELRRLVRRELESREQMRGEQSGYQQARRGGQDPSEDRQRIIEEEIEAFYRAKGGYVRYVNEDGDVEWITEAEIREREGQIPVDMEELAEGQRKVRNRMIGLLLLAFLGVVLLIVLMRDRTGTIQVISNVKGATVHLDGSATEFETDARLEHLGVGPHVISVSKPGHSPVGAPSQRVELKAGRTEVVILNLAPDRADTARGPR